VSPASEAQVVSEGETATAGGPGELSGGEKLVWAQVRSHWLFLLHAYEGQCDGAFPVPVSQTSVLSSLDLAPKGPDRSAQGNALGAETAPWKNRSSNHSHALKGRHN
jgi:hypothetical protein